MKITKEKKEMQNVEQEASEYKKKIISMVDRINDVRHIKMIYGFVRRLCK